MTVVKLALLYLELSFASWLLIGPIVAKLEELDSKAQLRLS
jgi:hypothetical protein